MNAELESAFTQTVHRSVYGRIAAGNRSIYGCTVWMNAELESAFTQTVHRSVYGRIAAGNRSITGVLYG